MKASTHERKAAEAKRMAREHALHANAHLRSGDLAAAAHQFWMAGEYASTAHDEAKAARRAAKARDGL